MPELTQEEALREYARMMNTLEVGRLADLLAEDFRYSSQWVFDEIASREAFLDYISRKLLALRESGVAVFAEMGSCGRPCVVLSQGSRQNRIATVLAEVKDGELARLDMCLVPPPESVRGTGELPR